MNFIKKIFESKTDESVHRQFIRFGKGVFGNRAIINFHKTAKIKLSTSFEFANDLINFLTSLVDSFNVDGILLSKENPQELLSKLNIKTEIKKKKGFYESVISATLNKQQINEIEKIAYFMLFDCSAPDLELKTKKKLPTIKPSNKTGEVKTDNKFCVLLADLKYEKQIHEEFLFDTEESKKVRISHTYDVKDIILPENEKDSEQIRLKAKRKGMLTRKIEFDGKEQINEREFVV